MVVKQYLLIKSTVSMAPAVTFVIVHCRTTHKHYSSLCMVLHYGVLSIVAFVCFSELSLFQ